MYEVSNQLMVVEENDFDESLECINSDGIDSDSLSFDFLIEALMEFPYIDSIKGVAPFFAIAVIGLIVFYRVNEQLGMFLVVALVPIAQYINNRQEGE